MTFGEKLQSLRKRRGWTQEELAAKIAVSRQALSKWELGTAMPDTNNVLQISKVFGVSTDFLLNDAFENASDIPAVQTGGNAFTQKYPGVMYAVIGGILSVISAAGLLIMAILSSIYPVYISYAAAGSSEMPIVRIGLPAFLKYYNIGWLFALCVVLFFAGVLIALYPRLRRLRRKNSGVSSR